MYGAMQFTLNYNSPVRVAFQIYTLAFLKKNDKNKFFGNVW